MEGLNFSNGYLYYSNWSDGGKVYKMKTDGTEKTALNSAYSEFINGARVLIGFNEKRSKIKGFRQSINGINLKIKYFSFQNTLRY